MAHLWFWSESYSTVLLGESAIAPAIVVLSPSASSSRSWYNSPRSASSESNDAMVVGRTDEVVVFDILILVKIASSVASFKKWQMSWNNDARQTKSSPELLFQA